MSASRLNFPAKLYQIIEVENPEIIKWEVDGKSFRIVNYQRFEKEVIPKFFRHCRIASIQRQLNLYGFKCVNRGEEKGLFFHPQFIRGQYDATRNIRRKKNGMDPHDLETEDIHGAVANSEDENNSFEPRKRHRVEEPAGHKLAMSEQKDASLVVSLPSSLTSRLYPKWSSGNASGCSSSANLFDFGPMSNTSVASGRFSPRPDEDEYFQALCRDLQDFDCDLFGVSSCGATGLPVGFADCATDFSFSPKEFFRENTV